MDPTEVYSTASVASEPRVHAGLACTPDMQPAHVVHSHPRYEASPEAAIRLQEELLLQCVFSGVRNKQVYHSLVSPDSPLHQHLQRPTRRNNTPHVMLSRVFSQRLKQLLDAFVHDCGLTHAQVGASRVPRLVHGQCCAVHSMRFNKCLSCALRAGRPVLLYKAPHACTCRTPCCTQVARRFELAVARLVTRLNYPPIVANIQVRPHARTSCAQTAAPGQQAS